MQKENGIEFDLQVKAMCEAASEPAPAGAWAAISSRVAAAGLASGAAAAGGAAAGLASGAAATGGAASGAKLAGGLFGRSAAGSRRVWGWTAAALAMAASLLLGVFLFNRTSGVSGQAADGLLAQNEVAVAVEPQTEVAEDGPVIDNLLIDSDLTISNPPINTGDQNLSSSSISRSCVSSSQTASEANDATAAQQRQETVAPASQQSDQAPETTKQEAVSPQQPDPFALMAAEDARKARSHRAKAIFAGGSITNNNASAGAGAYAASGNRTGKGISETSKSTYGLPLSFGAGISFGLSDRLSIATGLDYSLLSRSFSGTYATDAGAQAADIRHTMQYIGVPVNLYCRLFDIEGLHLYGFAGAEAEYGISNKYKVYAADKDYTVKEKVSGLQYSAAAGLGIEFRISDRLGIYLDPSARYYFDCKQPKSIRTEKPFLLVFDAGLRFNL